jgi:hypothetical protein
MVRKIPPGLGDGAGVRNPDGFDDASRICRPGVPGLAEVIGMAHMKTEDSLRGPVPVFPRCGARKMAAILGDHR